MVLLDQRGVQRQHHERQIAVDDADVGGDRGVQDAQRLLDQAQRQQRAVEHAVAVEDADPGVDADQERGPRRQHHQHHRDVARRRRQARDHVGHRIADQQGQQGGDPGDLDRAPVGFDVLVVAHQRQVVLQGELQRQHAVLVVHQRAVRRAADRLFGEGDAQHDQERDREEQQQPQIRCGDHQPARAEQAPLAQALQQRAR